MKRFTARTPCLWSLLCVAVMAVACVGSTAGEWGKNAKYTAFDPATLNPGGDADFTILVPLSRNFYERITARRFNSLATYEDPALREFFRTAESFSDYYAAFAEALDRASFESNRPTGAFLQSMSRTGLNRVEIRVRFRGANAKPLRFWSTHVVRTDQWEYTEGRWWVVPGKV